MSVIGGATVIEIEPGGNGGYRADMLLAKPVFLYRGHDLDDVKRRALEIARDKLCVCEFMNDALYEERIGGVLIRTPEVCQCES